MNKSNKKDKINKLLQKRKKLEDKSCQNKASSITNNKADSSYINIDHRKINNIEEKLLNLKLNKVNKEKLKNLKKIALSDKLKQKIDNIIENK